MRQQPRQLTHHLVSLLSQVASLSTIALFVLVPLYFSKQTYLAFELPKLVVFRILIEISFCCWLSAKILTSNLRLPPHSQVWPTIRTNLPWLLPLAVLLAVWIETTISSVSPSRAFWGNYYRGEGLFSQLHYIALFFVIQDIARSTRVRRLILYSMLLGGVLVSGYAVLEKFDSTTISDWKLATSAYQDRLLSTFGQPNFLAGYLILLIPIVIYLIKRLLDRSVESKKPTSNTANTLITISLYAFCLVLFGAILIYTKSRGALLAFIFAGTISALIFIFTRSKLSLYIKLAIILTSLAMLLVGGAITIVAARNSTSETAQRISSMFDPDDWTKTERYQMWDSTLKTIRQRPWLGSGFDSFDLVFYPNIRPGYLHLQTLTIDHPHNETLNLAISTGIIGFLSFVIFLISIIYPAARGRLDPKNNKITTLLIFVTMLSLLKMQFNLSSVVHFMILWSILGVLAAINHPGNLIDSSDPQLKADRFHKSSDKLPALFSQITQILLISTLLATTLGLIRLNQNIYHADVLFKQSQTISSTPPEQTIELLKSAVSYNPNQPWYRFHLAQIYLKWASTDSNPEQDLRDVYTLLSHNDDELHSAQWYNLLSRVYYLAGDLLGEDWGQKVDLYNQKSHEQNPWRY